MLVALTGATGFIGRRLLRDLPARGYKVRALLRRPTSVPVDCASAIIGDIAKPYNMTAALADVDAVIHLAGIAPEASGTPEDDYRTQNVDASVRLAEAAKRAGAKRFIFLSSVRAQAGVAADHVLNERSEPAPTSAYGRSKRSAASPRSGSTGSRCGWSSSMARASRATWRGSCSLRSRARRCRSAD